MIFSRLVPSIFLGLCFFATSCSLDSGQDAKSFALADSELDSAIDEVTKRPATANDSVTVYKNGNYRCDNNKLGSFVSTPPSGTTCAGNTGQDFYKEAVAACSEGCSEDEGSGKCGVTWFSVSGVCGAKSGDIIVTFSHGIEATYSNSSYSCQSRKFGAYASNPPSGVSCSGKTGAELLKEAEVFCAGECSEVNGVEKCGLSNFSVTGNC